MKKMKVVNQNDRIVINIIDHESIQYVLVAARTRKETLLGEPVDFSLSVKKYFGTKGRTIKELYGFKSWHNHKLQTEMKHIWRAIDDQYRVKNENMNTQSTVTVYHIYEDERAA